MTPAKPRPRNPRGEGERLRDEVVDAAAALIAENGPESLSLRAIARKAGITAPAIYRHFDDLDQVTEAVVDSFFCALADYLRRAGQSVTNPADRLRGLCRGYVAFGREHPQQYATLFSRGSALSQPAVDKSIERMQGAEAFAILLDAIRDCVDAGSSSSTRPVDDATAVWVALHGYVGLRTALPDFPWRPDDSLLDVLVDRLALLA